MDATALNFDNEANVNNFSCIYPGDPYIGTYEITDSLYVPMLSEISTVYQKVTIIGSTVDSLFLADYRNTDDTLLILMSEENFIIPEQKIWGSQVITGNGWFRNDSLFYRIEGEDYDNRGSGVKI